MTAKPLNGPPRHASLLKVWIAIGNESQRSPVAAIIAHDPVHSDEWHSSNFLSRELVLRAPLVVEFRYHRYMVTGRLWLA